MSGEDGAGRIIEAFPAGPTLAALPGGLFFIHSSSDYLLRITKRALSAFRPAKLSNSVVALIIIHRILNFYLQLPDSFREVEKAALPPTTSRPWNPT